MSDSDTTPKRISQRKTKGIPPARFENFEMPKNQTQPPLLPQGNTNTPPPPRNPIQPNANLSSKQPQVPPQVQPQVQTQVPPQVQPQVQTQVPPPAQPQGTSTSNSRPHEQQQMSSECIAAISREFDRKLTNMQNEFQRQMHAMQELMISNAQQVNNVLELRNERRQENINATQRPVEPARESSISTDNSTRSVDQRQKKIYPLPTFTGKPEEWQSFIESYKTTTTEFDYSNLHNIMRLREAISGKARETVEALLSNSANVTAILDVLEETYGRPEQLIKSQIEKMRQITPIAEDNLDQIVNLANKVTNMTTFLKNANGEHHLTNPTLLSEIVGKLPIARQLQWAEKCLLLDKPATLIEFSDYLNGIRRIANMVSDSQPIASLQKRHTATATPAASTSANLTKNSGRKFVHVAVVNKKCILCNGECSDLEHCSLFKSISVEARWEKVKDLKVCFSCMKKGHRTNQCYKKKQCSVNGCNRVHNVLLHNTNKDTTSTNTMPHSRENAGTIAAPVPNAEGASTSNRVSCHYNDNFAAEDVLFQVIPVKLYGHGTEVSTYAFIDDGANATIIDNQLAHQLGIRGQKSVLELRWLNRRMSSESTEIITIDISGVDKDSKIYRMSNVHTSGNLALPTQSFDVGEYTEQNVYLSDLPLHSYEKVQPKVIISLIHAYLTVPVEVPRTGLGPIATKTRLGWLAYGPLSNNVTESPRWLCHTYVKKCDIMTDLNNLISSYFSIESFGIKPNVKPPVSKDDARAMHILKNTIRKVQDRYEVALLWKESCPPFPESLAMAMKRLEGVERKMARDPVFAAEYCKKIEHYLKMGYAERLSTEDAEKRTAKTFYIPHFGVKNPNKSGIRLVFDAAAEVRNISLNKMLLPGPDINQPLLAILFKFRQAPVAVTGDIQEMFHQISVKKEDCDSQRFIWRKGKPENPIETFVMKRLIFGATCSPAVAQYVKNCNAKTFENVYPRAVQAICERHYVDDYVDCFKTEDEAITVVNQVINIHKAAGFNLRSIKSNSDKVKNFFGGQGEQEEAVNIEKEYDRILGMHWLTKSDVFVFKLKFNKMPIEILEFQRKPTKRELLSLHMSIFDPYGFLVNFMVTAKIIMQAVWKSGIQWDEQISDELYMRWKSWMEELPKVLQFKIPRCYVSTFETTAVDLHIFVDASEQALAVVAYWRAVMAGQVNLAFVAAKSSCAPIRYHTIPKMELQAATMGVRLKQTIAAYHDVKIRNCIFWSDSNTVLRWIRSDHRRYKQYVANRVAEILESSGIDQWRWCPGDLNPADDATRAKFPPQYNADSRWKLGPEFLMKNERLWPQETFGPHVEEPDVDEMRTKFVFVAARQVCYQVPNINRFSNYLRYKRATAWMLRYVTNLKRRSKKEDIVRGPLSADEERAAEIYLCRWAQMQAYSDDLADIVSNNSISSSSPLKMLSPFVCEDGLIRCKSRLERAECIPSSARRPIILPNNHALTPLIVQHYHNKLRHINIATIMCEIRQTFWIPSLRRLVNTAQSKCMVCKLRRAKPIQPQMSALPIDRVQPFVRPFTYTGVDFFGPINVTIRRAREKRWVCLFTCLTVRAVHLEVATNLSSDAFILCLRNFINRRGVPLQIRSDNGTNFVGVPTELKDTTDFLDHDDITLKLAPLGIKWIFNTPANPAQGGVWERLVQSVKKALYIMLKEEAPKLDTLSSLLIEAECIINSRPLTHLPVTPEEPEPLTPNHFLLGCTNSTQTPSTPEPRLMCLRKQWKVLANMKNCFWKRWMREYLPELTRRSKWCLPTQTLNNGCLVLICDPDAPRSQWRRGRVIELYPGKDGIARSAKVDTTIGVLKRPISKLALLDVEVSPNGQAGDSPTPESTHGGGSVGDTATLPY